MSDKHLFVMAKITPKQEYFESAKTELLGMLEATRSELGCIQFELHASECGCYIYLYEEWKNKVDLHSHHQESYTQDVAKKFEDWLAAPTEVSLMNKLL
ncbi:ABM domain-containing protein [Vibrio crassostreae]|uniref:putative quinol monooxygenase n=1 Tax=Vibrio TaxID=662 RepID=UPI001047440A|nr:antibiotic biosynthesis monooxygenase [Vibrio crassostreae]TCW19005.1 quinol monooxygenase YgiN [Vibrio crassostreae]CAK1835725.1 ABM domain-containing protein [Vibrio crassostreae]CAK1837808.1 ABM domain-containing protein [Vibrio crassostreae]CAK1840177.1 ABM domain-containing protein [Vibrio crassostreae]CAK1844804.1 ABM domain-containing protein [Vibrio crassostreae]